MVSDPIYQTAIARYQEAFRQHGESPAAVMWPKGRQDIRFASLTRHFEHDAFSLLDYGCGLADLKPFVDRHFPNARYSGADLVAEFIDSDRRRYPGTEFMLVAGPDEIAKDYDYVVMSGVFNLRYACSVEAHKQVIRDTLRHLFGHSRRAMSVDFMTDEVDYQGADAYHQNVGEIHQFARSQLSGRIIIDQSYLPYEYSLTVFKGARQDGRKPIAGR